MQLGGSGSSVLEISSHSKPVMAPHKEAAPSEGVEIEEGKERREIGEGERAVVGIGGGDDDDKISTSLGGNRWPRQETLALLKIRSDMDAVFRDSTLKGPLWDEVSRKLAEIGYHRSAKKCKEKFENVYKYHKRTKESRSGKSEGKTYKFFDQLQALETHNHHQFTLSSYNQPKPQPVLVAAATTTKSDETTIISHASTTFPSTNSIISPSLPPLPPPTTTVTNTTRNQLSSQPPNSISTVVVVPHSLPNNNMNQIFSSPSSTSTSSSTASDEGLEERYRKKRKWKDYFRRLTRKVLTKQEEMQKRFLEAIDKRERERVAQEDSWRMQELARINKEHEILVQERSNAAAKDAAVIALLHKLSGQEKPQQLAAPPPMPPAQHPAPSQVSQPPPRPQPQPQPQPPIEKQNNFEIQGMNNNDHTVVVTTSTTPMRFSFTSSSRWPKSEIHALIRLRTSLEPNYQENGPKAPLWEDISAGMQRLGYSRSAKRCKEKWENINKYFKKVKESNKQRREDSKTCPYFHELDALHREKSKNNQSSSNNNPFVKSNEMMMEPLMVQPEQQWRPPPQYHDEQQEGIANNKENTTSQHLEKETAAEEAELEEDEYVDGDIEEDEDSVEDDEGSGRYEIVTNKLSSVDAQLNETR